MYLLSLPRFMGFGYRSQLMIYNILKSLCHVGYECDLILMGDCG